MATPKQAQEAALLAMIKQLLPEQEILGSEIETIYAAVDYIRELSAMLEWEYDIILQYHNFSAHIYHYLLKTCATKLLENIQKLFKKWEFISKYLPIGYIWGQIIIVHIYPASGISRSESKSQSLIPVIP